MADKKQKLISTLFDKRNFSCATIVLLIGTFMTPAHISYETNSWLNLAINKEQITFGIYRSIIQLDLEMDSKNRNCLVLALLIGTILTSGCNNSRCGDGICQSLEKRSGSCPQDCVTDSVPQPFVALYNELETQISKLENSLPIITDKNHDPIFAAELLTANSNRGKNLLAPNVIIGLNYELDRLEELGVDGVVISVNFPLLFPGFHEDSSDQGAYLIFIKKLLKV